MRPFPYSMKNLFRIAALAFCGFLGTTFADGFKSLTFNGTSDTIHVNGDQFMVIRNFTQEGGTDRGVVMVSKPPTGTAVNVLSAAILDTTTNPPEVINNVVIAGPANVTFMCGTGATDCFVSYKKADN